MKEKGRGRIIEEYERIYPPWSPGRNPGGFIVASVAPMLKDAIGMLWGVIENTADICVCGGRYERGKLLEGPASLLTEAAALQLAMFGWRMGLVPTSKSLFLLHNSIF
jgi:hypothetical protein